MERGLIFLQFALSLSSQAPPGIKILRLQTPPESAL